SSSRSTVPARVPTGAVPGMGLPSRRFPGKASSWSTRPIAMRAAKARSLSRRRSTLLPIGSDGRSDATPHPYPPPGLRPPRLAFGHPLPEGEGGGNHFLPHPFGGGLGWGVCLMLPRSRGRALETSSDEAAVSTLAEIPVSHSLTHRSRKQTLD